MEQAKREQYSQFGRAFGLTLLLMLIVLGTVSLLYAYQKQHRGRGEEEELAGTYLPTEEDALTMLVAGRENPQTPPDLYFLLGFLPEDGRIAVCALSPRTYLEYQNRGTTLGALFEEQGVLSAVEALQSTLEIPVECYAVVDQQGFSDMMTAGGLVDYYLPVDLLATLHGRKIHMPRGNYQLDGRKAADIMIYPDYPGGELERSDRAAMLLSTLLTKHLPAVLTDRGKEMLDLVLENMETNLTYAQCQERKQAAQFLAKLDLQATSVVFVEGSLSKDHSRFHLTGDCIQRIQQIYGRTVEKSSPQVNP